MSKAAELAALIANVNNGSSLANKNLIINGAFTVHQRKAINTTSTENDDYATADRFKPSASNMDNLAITQQVTNSAPVGFENSYKYVVTTAESALASNELFRIMQFIEGQNLQHLNYGTSSAKPVTLSFWVRSSLTGTYAVSMYADSGSKIIGSTYTISSADTWEKKEITLVGDTAQAITNDSTEGLRLNWILMAGSDYTGDSNASWVAYGSSKLAYGHTAAWGQSTDHDFYLAGVQLEVGEKATEFEHEPYETTLLKCQRYLQRWEGSTSVSPYLANGRGHSTAVCITAFNYMTQFRASPSISFNGAWTYDGASQAVASVALNGPMPTTTGINWTVSSGLTQHRMTQVYLLDTSNTPYVELEAEL